MRSPPPLAPLWRPLALSSALLAACAARPPGPAAPAGARGEPGGRRNEGASAGPAEPTVLSAEQRRRDAAEAPRIAALLDAYSNFGASLSPDGRRLLFRSDRGGSAELYSAEVARPEAPPTKLVSGPERVASAVFTPDGRAILYRQDKGADENFHIFRLPAAGGAPVDLTPGEPLWRDSPLVPRLAPGLMVYSARKRTDYTSMLFVQALPPEGRAPRPVGASPAAEARPKKVFSDPLPGTAVDVSPDGARALWVRETRGGGHEALEIDVRAGRAEPVARDVSAVAYSSDGARIFVATESPSGEHALAAIDRATRAPLARYVQSSPATAAVRSIVPSPRGDRVAIGVDAGNRSSVRVLDAKTLAPLRDVATPPGTASLGANTEVRFPLGAGTFSGDGARFAIGLSTPDRPDDVALVDAATGALSPLRREPRPELAGLAPVVASIEEVASFDGLAVPVNVYLPKGHTSRLPTLVYFHGGPDASSALEWNAWTRVFIAAGFAVLEPNVRGSTGFGRAYEAADNREKRADSMRDVEAVNRWARRQAFCDPDRLIIYGASYGGYVSLMGLSRQPGLWAAGVDLAGISDLMTILRSDASPARYVAEFGEPGKDDALIEAFSPLRDADKIAAPLFIYQGQNDARVPRAQADAIVQALRARNVPVEYMVAPDEGHTVARRPNEIEFLSRVIRFLRDELHIAS
jgi:dienelactone hydrolase